MSRRPLDPGRDGELIASGTPLLSNRLEVHSSAWVAPGAVLVGDVTIGQDASVWYGCVLRGDVGARSPEPASFDGFVTF